MGKLETIDWDSEAHLREPHAAYAIGRQESPVYRVPGKDLVMVFGYDAVIEALMKPLVFSSRNEQALLGTSIHSPRCREIYARGWPQVETLLTNDPPSHTRFKKLVNRAFTREKVDGLEGQITGIVDRLIDAFAAAGHCEFVRDFAIPLPCTVIARQLGIDTADVPRVKAWSDAFIELIGSALTEEQQVERALQVVEFQHYMKARIDERRTAPRADMLTDLLNARVDDERPLDEAELLSVAQQLMVAGNATTTHMLAGGLLTLIDNPAELARVRADHSLVPNMVEELLRMQTPTQGMWRHATEDTALAGVPIPKGTMLLLMFTSANRDAKYFPDPDRFDVTRDFSTAHVAFSRGIHTCIGMMLSRKELVVAFRRILERLEDIRLDPARPRPRYIPSPLFRGVHELPITFRARGA
ncbi:MAG: cytochrome P450 [Gammaproteobacteria bacterium]